MPLPRHLMYFETRKSSLKTITFCTNTISLFVELLIFFGTCESIILLDESNPPPKTISNQPTIDFKTRTGHLFSRTYYSAAPEKRPFLPPPPTCATPVFFLATHFLPLFSYLISCLSIHIHANEFRSVLGCGRPLVGVGGLCTFSSCKHQRETKM